MCVRACARAYVVCVCAHVCDVCVCVYVYVSGVTGQLHGGRLQVADGWHAVAGLHLPGRPPLPGLPALSGSFQLA